MFEELPTDEPGWAAGWVVPGVPPQRAAQASAELQALQAATRALMAVDPARLGGQEALEHTQVLFQVSEQLRLLGLAGLAQVHERGLHDLDGAPSAATWVSSRGLTADRTDLAVAKRLSAFPGVAEGVVAGRLPLPAAHALQTTLVKLRPHLDRGDGRIDGQPAEELLTAVLVDGVRMVVAESRGGFPTADDPVLARLLTELPEIVARPVSQLHRVEQALVLLAEHVEPAQLTAASAFWSTRCSRSSSTPPAVGATTGAT